MEALGRLTHLRKLDLSRSPLISDNTLLAVGNLTNLVSLNLTWGFPGSNDARVPSGSERRYSSGTLGTVISALPHLVTLNLAIRQDWAKLSVGSLVSIVMQPGRGGPTQAIAFAALKWAFKSKFEEAAAGVEASMVGVTQLVALLETPATGDADVEEDEWATDWRPFPELSLRSRAAILLWLLFVHGLSGSLVNLCAHFQSRPRAVSGLVAVIWESQVWD